MRRLAFLVLLVAAARAAAEPAPTRPRLTYLAADMPASEVQALAAAAPNVRIIAGLTRETAVAHAAEADGADAYLVSPELLKKAPRLRWIHARFAGVERLLAVAGIANERIVITNSRAVAAPTIAEHVMAMLLALTRNLPHYGDNQHAEKWEREDPSRPSIALQGRTMLVVGLGGIGSEIAHRAKGFGMRVIATRRTDAAPGPDVEKVGKPSDLLAFLPEADVVAIAVPLTPETERMFDAKAFAAMKPGAYLLNIARGRVVDTDALVRAIDAGRLGGVGLDVTEPEPLPPNHPLWKKPNVLITPHVAADAVLTSDRMAALFRENVKRWGAGEALQNVVDKKAGY